MRFARTKIKTRPTINRRFLKVGFGATLDCAVLIAAKELGLFNKHGLAVQLSREVGWATVREKLLHEELDAAAAPAGLLFSVYCGLGVVRRSCLTGLLLGLNGSAITLSNELWDLGARDAASLGKIIREQKDHRTFTFGMVLELSTQNYNLRKWLKSGGIYPDRDVRLAVVPSALMYDTYRSGHLDGYCVADPWNSAAALGGTGWVVATTGEIEPQHPEKVLFVLQEFAEKREEEHLRMIAALIEASEFCDAPANRGELAQMLARPRYFDVNKNLLANALVGPFESGRGRRAITDFVIYGALKAGNPNRARGKWVFDLVRALDGHRSSVALRTGIIPKIFREDIFQKAAERYRASSSRDQPAAPLSSAAPETAGRKPEFSPGAHPKPPGIQSLLGATGLCPEMNRASGNLNLPEASVTLCN